jgi:hypothetical protein
MPEIDPILNNLYNEKIELGKKLDNLRAFIDSEKFQEIDSFQQTLLNIQIKAMETYRQCLAERISRFYDKIIPAVYTTLSKDTN